MTIFNEYHVHLYYEVKEIAKAEALVEKVRASFDLQIGRIWDRPVGPHPIGSCQITLPQSQFADFIPWLMRERGELDAFIHADTGNDLIDHTEYVMWLGKSYPLNLEIFT